MKASPVNRESVLLSLQRALLGEVFPALRAVTVEWSEGAVKFVGTSTVSLRMPIRIRCLPWPLRSPLIFRRALTWTTKSCAGMAWRLSRTAG